jgi:hypothetical protein
VERPLHEGNLNLSVRARTFAKIENALTRCATHRTYPVIRRAILNRIGYWAKKEAGKKVKQTIFVKVDDPLLDRIDIAPARDNIPEPGREIIEQRRAERKASRPSRSNAMTPPATERVNEPHPAIRAITNLFQI